MAGVTAFSHVALTVTDLQRSENWYSRVLGLVRVLADDDGSGHRLVYLVQPQTLLGVALHSHAGNPGTPFSETVTGLDHVSFQVGSRADLDEWADRLAGLGVTHSSVVEASYGSVLSFRDPDRIALEFFFLPQPVMDSIRSALEQAG